MTDHAVCVGCDQLFDSEDLVGGECFICRVSSSQSARVVKGVPT